MGTVIFRLEGNTNRACIDNQLSAGIRNWLLSIVLISISQIVAAEQEPASFRDCSDCPEMVGLPDKPFAIGKYEVTFEQWDACVSDGSCDGYKPVDGRKSTSEHWGREKRPVIYVNWDDTQSYLQWLSKKAGKSYRLPKEAEWEYACYGGRKTEYCGSDNIKEVAWYEDNSESQTQPVGKKKANGYGLYDMSGNVWEWTDDCGEASCTSRVVRGGSWNYAAQLVRATTRLAFVPTIRSYSYGFRVARSLP